MEIIGSIFLAIIIIVCVGVFTLWHRNNLTYQVRTNILDINYKLYSYLPRYNDMLYSLRPLNTRYWVRYCEKQRDKRKVNEK